MGNSGWKVVIRFSDGGRLTCFATEPAGLAKLVLEEALHQRTVEISLTRVPRDGTDSINKIGAV